MHKLLESFQVFLMLMLILFFKDFQTVCVAYVDEKRKFF